MTEFKGTPGPWKCGPTTGRRYQRIIMSNQGILGVVYGNSEYNDDENAANAHLIAAAPELLGALEDLASLAEAAMREVGEYDIEAELADARAAIAKALGETT